MFKRHFIIILLILFPLIVGLACLGSSKTPTLEEVAIPVEGAEEIKEEPSEIIIEETEETKEPEDTGEPKDLVLLEKSFWIQDDSSVFVSFFFENPNDNLLFEDVEYTVFLYNADGEEIDNDYSTVRWIFPNQTFGIVFTFYLSDENVTVDSAFVEWEVDEITSPNGFTNPFTVDEAVFWENDNFPIVTGKISNQKSETYTDIRANIICYNAAGDIVGGGYTYVDFIPGSDDMGFADYVDVFDEVASVEVYPTFTYNTIYYEGSDFWSEILILDDYFYQGSYNSIYGGAVIQNTTDYVLEDSILSVTIYDEEGHVTSTGDTYIDILLPGDSIGISPWVLSPPDETDSAEYDILVLPGEYVDDYELEENPFVINSTEVIGDYDSDILVNFTNTYTKQISETEVYVLVYNADGQIIGGGSDWTEEPIPAGGTAEIEVWIDYSDSQTIDRIEAWVAPTYWTEFE